jgi:tetratricopeptide (TPR) repeat protein
VIVSVLVILLAQAVPAAQRPDDQPAVAVFRAAMEAQQRGDLERAVEAYERAIALDPKFAEAHANLGAVLARLGHYEQAVRAYERALSLKPQLNAARVNLGLAHYRAGALPSALREFKAAYAADPSLLQVRQLLGLVLVELGRDDEAVPYLEASLQAAPQEPAVLFALGRVYAKRRDSRADVLAERLRDAPEGRSLWQQLRGLVLQQDNRHEQALAAFEEAAALNDALPRIFVNIGVSHLALGDHAAARQAFEKARNRSEHDAAAHLYLAWLDEQDERLPDAQRHAERAVALEDVAESRGLLGRIVLKQGKSADAIDHLARAVAAAPQNASWRFLLAQAYQRTGNAKAAATEFAEARRLKEQEVARERK